MTELNYRDAVDLLGRTKEQIQDEWRVPYNATIDSFGAGGAATPHLLITLGGGRRISSLSELISVVDGIDEVVEKNIESESYSGQYGDAVRLTLYLKER